MPESYVEYTSDESTTDYAFDIPYLTQGHVHYYLNAVMQPEDRKSVV